MIIFSICLTVHLTQNVKKLIVLCDREIQSLLTEGGRKSKEDKGVQMEYFTVSPPTTVDTQKPPKVQVFYNLFTTDTEDEERVQNIVNEQFLFLDPKIHNQNVYITFIGYQLKGIPTESINQHHLEGDEGLTLYALWDYCNMPENKK